jgi:zinc/manganese transport system ATP-binding protein
MILPEPMDRTVETFRAERLAAARHRGRRESRSLGGGGVGPDVNKTGGIRLRNLTVAYERHPAVHHLSGAFESGSMTAVVGPNGAGKSTLLKTIVGLLRPSEGHIELQGVSPSQIAYLPQAAEIDRSFPISVLETVLLGHWNRVGWFRGISREQRAQAQRALSAVGLEGFERRPVGSLSAGQFQRVLFARLLLQDAAIVLLDEPFTAIDARTTRDLLDLVGRWHTAERRTVVAVLHDTEQVRQHFPRTLMIAREAIGWGPTQEVLTASNLLKARCMAESWDEEAVTCDQAGTAA